MLEKKTIPSISSKYARQNFQVRINRTVSIKTSDRRR